MWRAGGTECAKTLERREVKNGRRAERRRGESGI